MGYLCVPCSYHVTLTEFFNRDFETNVQETDKPGFFETKNNNVKASTCM